MQLHPALIVLVQILLRMACFVVAAGRALGLSLADGANTFWPYVPALALLYFSASPKPLPLQWRYVAISTLISLFALIVMILELPKRPAYAGYYQGLESAVLLMSTLAHIAYCLWRNRSPKWGLWQRV